MAKTSVLNNYYFSQQQPALPDHLTSISPNYYAPSPLPSTGFLQFWDRFFFFFFFFAFCWHDTTGGQASKCTHREGDYGHGTPGDFYSSSGSLFLGVQLEPQYTLVCMQHLILVPWNSSRIITGVANANFLYYYIKSVVTNYSVRHGTLFHLHATRSSATETE